MHKVFLGIGGNIGDKLLNLKKAKELISHSMGKIVLVSSIYESQPWGFRSEHVFWNQVLMIETTRLPIELLEEIRQIENNFGRVRDTEGYSSRQMDIDILFYDDLIVETPDLIIPHPLLQKRKFVVTPLAEIAPDLFHPVLKLTSYELDRNCKDNLPISKII